MEVYCPIQHFRRKPSEIAQSILPNFQQPRFREIRFCRHRPGSGTGLAMFGVRIASIGAERSARSAPNHGFGARCCGLCAGITSHG